MISLDTIKSRPMSKAVQGGKMISLDTIKSGKYVKPWITLIFGPEKIGKTTFASDAPSPIFLDTQEGSFHREVDRWDVKSWQDILDTVEVLATQEHSYKTLVIDTVDDAESFLWRHICERDGKAGIEDYGYGKGYVAALDEWRLFLHSIQGLQKLTGMNVLVMGHVVVKLFKNPAGEDFDRYQLKMHQRATDLFKEHSDCVLFANHKTYTVKDEMTKKHKGFGDDSRYLYSARTASYDAGNRYTIPSEMPLSYASFAAAMTPKTTAEIMEEIQEKSVLIDDKQVHEWISKTAEGADRAMLMRINNRLTAKLSEGE